MTCALQLGSAAGAQQAISTGGAIATGVLPAVTSTAWVVPVVGAAVAGVTLALGLILNRKGPKQKVATTQIVNELEPLLRQNLEAFQAGPQTKTNQEAALANFDSAWAWLASEAACGSPDLGNPGKACISDRQRGGQWDWFAYYRDPVANAPVSDDSVSALLSGDSMVPFLIGAALIGAALLL